MKPECNYTCNKDLEIIEVDGEWIILDTENFMVTKVNTIGAIVIQSLQEQKTFEEIIQNIEDLCDVNKNNIVEDIKSFLEDVRKVGLVSNE